MILKLYGTSFHSVETNFDGKALNEVGFRRDHAWQMSVDDFADEYEGLAEHAFRADAEGDVHTEVEQRALDDLEDQLEALRAELAVGEVLVIENDGSDWPKTRQETSNVIVEGENRLAFTVRIDPPLRLRVYSKRG